MPLPPDIRSALRRLEVASRRQLAGALAGEYRSHFRGRGMEFAELRPYLPGDDVRQIDWNVTARSGAPHLRLYQEERRRTLTLLADLSPSCTPPKRELLLETAALLTFAAAGSRDHIALVAFSDRVEHLVPPAAGRNHALRILHDLMSLRPEGRGTDLAPPLEAALGLNRRPGMVILLSDLHAPLPERLLRRTTARHDLLALIPRDPGERELAAGLVAVRDAEGGADRLLDLASAKARAEVAAGWEHSDRECAASLRGMGVDHAFLQSGAPPLPALLALFRRRGRK